MEKWQSDQIFRQLSLHCVGQAINRHEWASTSRHRVWLTERSIWHRQNRNGHMKRKYYLSDLWTYWSNENVLISIRMGNNTQINLSFLTVDCYEKGDFFRGEILSRKDSLEALATLCFVYYFCSNIYENGYKFTISTRHFTYFVSSSFCKVSKPDPLRMRVRNKK